MLTSPSGFRFLLVSLFYFAGPGLLWAGPGYVQSLDPALGTVNNGVISLPGQEDRFVFAGTAGQRVFYDTLELDGQGLQYRLVAPSGEIILGTQTQNWESAPVYLNETGGHTFVMDGAGDATGNYSFRLLNVDTEPAVTAGTITPITLAPSSQTVIRRFTGTAGQRVALDSVSASANAAQWALVNPANQTVASSSVDYDLGTNLLATAGTWLVIVQGTVGDNPDLEFSFRIRDVSDAPVAASGFGTVHSGSVAQDATNSFTFTAPAGTVAYYDSLQTYNGVTAQLLDPDGNALHQGDAGYNGGPLVLPRSGTYTVNLIGSTAGDYSFRMLNCSAAPVLSLGAINSAVMNPAFRTDVWRVIGQPGQRLLYDATETDYEPVEMKLWSPQLAWTLWQNAEYDSGPFSLTLPGTHYLIVESGTSDPAADYSFRLLDAAQAPSVPLAFSAAITNTLGPNRVQLYRFDAVAGQRLYFDALGTDTGAIWTLYDPVNASLAAANTSSDFVYTVTRSGQHLLSVSAGDLPVDYAFRVLDPGTTNQPLTLGAVTVGTIAAAGEEHRYIFTGTAGQRLFYDTLQDDWQDITVRLLNPRGQVLWWMNSDSETYPLTLTEAGTYTLVLGGLSDVLGSYSFRLIDVNQSPAAPLALNTLVSGTNNPGLQATVFRVPLTANRRLYCDSQLPDAGQWTLHGADNNYLGGTLLSGDFEPLPTLTGTGLLIISGGAAPLGYSVRVVDPVHASGAIAVGTVVSNLLVGAGSEHRLTFTAAPGQRLYFDALDQDWDAVSAGLLGPDGNSQWNTGADSDYGYFTVAQPGTHTLVVHNSTDAAADYRFRLLDLAAQPALTSGVTQSGQLNPRTQAHVYRFSGTNGQRVHLESVAASSGDAYWFIQDPFNTTLAANSINASIGNVFLPIHGTYAVIVSGNGPDSGTLDYQIRLSDVSDAPVAASGLGSFFGNVASGDTNIVYFNASAGTPIYVDSLTNNSSVTLRLSDTHGAVVFEANGSDGAYDPGFHTLPTSGTYTLEIVGSSGGDYAFRILNLNTDALPLTPAAVYAGTLTNGFQTEIFRLPGTNGQRLFYDALEGDFDQVYAALVAPNFNPLFGGVGSWWWWGNNADLDAGPVTLSVSGPHYLIIRSAVAETNHYAFRLLDLFQPPAQAINVGATYGSGLVPVPSSSLVVTGSYVAGNLRFVDEPDWRVTQTIAGTRVDAQINFSNVNWGTLSSVGFTEGPNGSDADWENYSVQWDGRITITNTGTRLYLYSDNSSRLWADLNSNGVFEASELLDNQWGMEIGDRSPASAPIAAGVYSIRIQYEETYGQNQMVLLWDNGSNLGPYEAQVFHFTNNAAPFFFDSVQQSPPSWNHYPPGADTAITGQGWLTDFESSASVAGTNVLIIQNQTASGQPYGFRVLTPASATNALTLGTPHSGSLTAGQDHWFTFAGTAGQRLYYDSLNPQVGNMSVRLVAPSGAVLVSDGYYAYDAGPLTLTESGIHRVRLHNNLDTVTAYSFRLLDVAAQPLISLDATNSGSVANGAQARLFRFDSLARLHLIFDDLGSGQSGYSQWNLYDPANQLIGGSSVGSDFEVANPAFTANYLLVFNGSITNSYDYTFRIVPGNHAPAFTSGGSLAGDEMTALSLTHTASDLEAPNDQLTFSLEGDIPAGLTLDASTGAMDWMPTEAQGPSTNTFTVRVTDDGIPNLSTTRAFTVIVNEVNRAPSLTVPGPQVVNELVALSVSASATDPDIPANVLTFSLLSPPGGMTINPATGAIAWSPSEAQGPGFYTVSVVVTDTNAPAVNAKQLSATNSFTVTVNEVNVAPVLPVQTNRTINELTLLSVTNTATDADLPANVLTYTLENPPVGAAIDTNGVIAWTPSEAQGPGVYTLKTIVADNGVPVLRATNSFAVTVNEVNVAPVLSAIADRATNPGQTVTLTASATDADSPPNALTFSLVSGPVGATINSASGLFTWRPPVSRAGTSNYVQVRVADNGSPSLTDVKGFAVLVNTLVPVMLSPLGVAGGEFSANVTSGTIGPDHVLQGSTNLTDWVNLSTNTPTALPFALTDPNAGAFPKRFYRVKLEP